MNVWKNVMMNCDGVKIFGIVPIRVICSS